MKHKEQASNSPTTLNVEGAAQHTGVPEGTLRFWRATNQGPRSYLVGRRLRYDIADLDAWLAAQQAQSVRGGVEAVSA
jgi:hypothetical protein